MLDFKNEDFFAENFGNFWKKVVLRKISGTFVFEKITSTPPTNNYQLTLLFPNGKLDSSRAVPTGFRLGGCIPKFGPPSIPGPPKKTFSGKQKFFRKPENVGDGGQVHYVN
jgi:hypothetical protein